ncbi:hypothetical protein K402DRAFT_446855 [Aulographum hederae CBS 113979]|uniref:Uncharacterized protein n=1 Tax=Aulographum hederae CBS 113979 TaxID=1176131 RepID=A0A6G1GY38_9PEZI|nr:hypothetical protein K402DRAFT_446855 [Aulographum hederae CBS 113979]
MFSFASNASGFVGRHDSEKWRNPPPPPTPVEFPSVPSSRDPQTWTSTSKPDLVSCYRSIRKPSDLTEEQCAALNVTFEPPTSFEELISEREFLPPKPWLDFCKEGDVSSVSMERGALLSNGRNGPTMRDFVYRYHEIAVPNDDAFRALSKTPKFRDQKLPRLAHFRKFWEDMDNMVSFWDTSLDEFRDAPAADDEDTSMPDAGENSPSVPDVPSKDGHKDSLSGQKGANSVDANPLNIPLPSTSPEPLKQATYRGLRLSTGSSMPHTHRINATNHFLEGVAWAFGLNLAPHRRPVHLAVSTMRLPVRLSTAIWQAPTDRTQARSGILAGPVLAASCGESTGKELENDGAIVDLYLRELAGILALAQERAREGREEKKPGDGEWWTTKPRWGGAEGGEVGEDNNPDAVVGGEEKKMESEDVQEKQDKRRSAMDELLARGLQRAKGKKKGAGLSPMEAWKTVQPGQGTWDPKIQYKAVGKPLESEWDEVFMLSSLNHHISLLKLRVHRSYTDFLTTNEFPSESIPQDPEWCKPRLQRTRWYDLLQPDDRVEAMAGLWGVIAYLMRVEKKDEGREVFLTI